jgi:hypothetical protein
MRTVYFIQRGETGPIKIGKTRHDPRRRMATLQVGSAERLHLLGCCAEFEETKVHFQFRQHRMSGEWFMPHPDILDFIQTHTEVPQEKPNRNEATDKIPISFRVKKSTYLSILERQTEIRREIGLKPSVGAVVRAMLGESYDS